MDGTPGHSGPGRPTKYRKAFDGIANRLCRQHGYTDEKLAEVLGVGYTTLREWKDRHPEFAAAIRNGKDEFDNEHVESALLKRAKGFIRKRVVKRTRTVLGQSVTEITEAMEEVPGSVRAQETWLYNRHRDRWKRLVNDDAEGEGGSGTAPLVVPKDEDLDTWLRSKGVDPDSSNPDGCPTPADNGSS